MTAATAAFAIPGDIATKTGGYIYERSLLLALREMGREVAHIRLGASFPHPTPADTGEALAALEALPATTPLILDGLVFASIDTEGLARIRAPVIAMLHHPCGLETGLAPERAAALLAREGANLALARHVVVPSPHSARVYAAEFGVAPGRISIAPPGFDRPAPPTLPKDDPPLILSVGLLCERKGHDVLLRALASVADLDWRAEIVGLTHDPAVEMRLREMIATLGLEGRARLAGCVDEAALEALYARAGLFALATRYEGYGMAFAEALLRGLPIVTCAVGAVPETVPEAAGFLLPPDDPAAFADALRRLLSNPALRQAKAEAAQAAGAALPRWADTAAIMARVLDRALDPI